ncbi:MFS transporter [Bacillus sp. M6-12]|uniref:MFS transporter n=1 Tax=Bacillus sp. M6-12 TaxID=2054166 RepID=UPI000C7942D4|nr:MFS transporter [Bacillus sp. M6-12]PLS17127.1 MFS transporter [Bacillus sp. M6-12]
MKSNTLASHNITVLFWINLFGSISFIQPVMTLFYIEKGLTESHILWIMMFWSGAVLLAEVPTGIFADKYGAKASFLTGSFFKFISVGLLLFADEPWLFMLCSFINGCSVTFFSGADEALLYDSLKESEEQHLMDRAMGKITSANFFTMTAAVIIGAFLAKDLKQEQFNLLIGLGMFFQLVEFGMIFFVKNPQKATSYRENPFLYVKKGFKVIRKTPQLLYMFINLTLVFIPAGAVFNKFDQLILKEAAVPVEWIGVLYALAGIAGFFATRHLGWLTAKFSSVSLMHITGIMAVIGLLLSVMAGHNTFVIIGAFFLLKTVNAIRYPIYSQLSNDWIPSEVRATTISLLSILDSVFDLVIFLTLAGAVTKGMPIMLAACAAIAFAGTLVPIRKGVLEENAAKEIV